MGQFVSWMLRVLVIAGFLILFVLCVVFIKPLHIHKKRPQSTIVLKFSYLVYLAVLMAFFYNLIFETGDQSEIITNLHFFLVLLALFVPNAGILARRQVKEGRTVYNYVLTIINITIIYYLVWLFARIEGLT